MIITMFRAIKAWQRTAIRCWHWPERFTLSHRQHKIMWIVTGGTSTLLMIVLLIFVLTSYFDSKDPWIDLKLGAGCILMILPPIIVIWITGNSKPGKGYVYLPTIDDYMEINSGRYYYEDALQDLEDEYRRAKDLIKRYPALRERYRLLDNNVKQQYRDQLNDGFMPV